MGVNIYESPIKPVVDLEDGVTVYVPGYAYYGPEEPTLCTTESEFEGLFGTKPYIFEEDQEPVGGPKIAKGSPEKGYLYAKSLLASGLQVLFHRFKGNTADTAEAEFNLAFNGETYPIVIKATSFGKSYSGIKVKLVKNEGNLYDITITDPDGNTTYTGTISFDPASSIYFKTTDFGLVEFVSKNGAGEYIDIEDTKLAEIIKSSYNLTGLTSGEAILEVSDTAEAEFNLASMYTSLATAGAEGMMYPLTDFERYPSVTYITSGGYYIDKSAAGNLMSMAEKIKAIALIDLNLGVTVKDQTTWKTAQSALAGITGSTLAKGKAATFIGCNSFDLSPYRIVLGDSFNYLKCLGENMKKGIAAWIPVANDPNGVSPLGYDTTNKISTELSETMGEGKIGVSANPLIYSTSAGGYKIMGNRTLLSNDGVLSPNSFLNVSVVVNRVERACRQTANKLKIVSTNPVDTFIKFKNSVAKTIEPMVVQQDGIKSYKIRHLPKTKPATIDIEIALVVVEGIETFNIYIPYSIALD